MTTSDFIGLLLDNYDLVPASDADNATRRLRLLEYTQEAFDEIWNYADWRFSYKTGTVTFNNATDTGDLPSDFMEFGQVGGLWNGATFVQLAEIKPVDAYAQAVAGAALGLTNNAVAQFGVNTSTGVQTLRTPGNVTATSTVPILYRTIAPTLVDADDLTGNLWCIPVAYHRSTLLPCVVQRLKKADGDSRDYAQDFRLGIATMQSRERVRKTTTRFMPATLGGMW